MLDDFEIYEANFFKICVIFRYLDITVMSLFHILSVSLIIGGGTVNGYFPSNTVVVVGDPLVIHCKATSNETSILWKFGKLGGVGEEPISNKTWIQKPGFSVNSTEDGQFSLAKENTQLNDSGTYKCLGLQTGHSPQIAVAQVAILPSPPECGTNASTIDSSVAENDFLGLWCQINYTGSMFPIIQWSRSDGRNSTVHNTNTTSKLLNSVTSRVTELMTPEDNGVRYECKIHLDKPPFTESQTGVRQAMNVPDYTYSWKYVSKVLFGPRNISIGPQKNDYSPEDTLVCSADGNPPPTYEWIELSDPRTVFKGPELHLNKTLTAVAGTRQYTYNCTATNKKAIVSSTIRCNVTGENRSDVSSPALSDSSNTLATIIMTGCMTAGAFAAIFFVCWFVYRLRKKKKQLKKENGSGSSNSQTNYDVIEEHALQNLTDESTNCDQPQTTTTFIFSGDNNVDQVQQEQHSYTKLSADRTLSIPHFYTPLDQRDPATNDALYQVAIDVDVDYGNESQAVA